MSIEKAKKMILKTFLFNSQPGTELNLNYCWIRAKKMNLDISDVVQALQQLKYDGILNENCSLSELGSRLIYTPDIFQIKLKILNEISKGRYNLNNQINLKYFLLKYNAYKNITAQKYLKIAINELISEGKLIEYAKGKYKAILPS